MNFQMLPIVKKFLQQCLVLSFIYIVVFSEAAYANNCNLGETQIDCNSRIRQQQQAEQQRRQQQQAEQQRRQQQQAEQQRRQQQQAEQQRRQQQQAEQQRRQQQQAEQQRRQPQQAEQQRRQQRQAEQQQRPASSNATAPAIIYTPYTNTPGNRSFQHADNSPPNVGKNQSGVMAFAPNAQGSAGSSPASLVNSACAQDARTAGCAGAVVGKGLLVCLNNANISPNCRTAIQQFSPNTNAQLNTNTKAYAEVNTACIQDARTAGCPGAVVGKGLLVCLSKADLSPNCRVAIKQLNSGQNANKQPQQPQQNNEKLAADQYLKSVAAGTRLVATKCPDGEGKYYATGSRPRIKPEVVGCVDVHFRAYCAGSAQSSEGTAKNFIGMSGCFGDTYEINPKPNCKVDQVRIEVVSASACSS